MSSTFFIAQKQLSNYKLAEKLSLEVTLTIIFFSIQEKILGILIPRFLACAELVLFLVLVKQKHSLPHLNNCPAVPVLRRGSVWCIWGGLAILLIRLNIGAVPVLCWCPPNLAHPGVSINIHAVLRALARAPYLRG